ncbi:MAG TPA: hypothetical protein VGD08_23000 [Stellaceae bacterium]|jgi:hypothetical protein
MSNETRWVVCVVLGVVALAAVVISSHAHSDGALYGLLGLALVCYLGIFLMLKLAFDTATGREDHSGPDL